MTVRPLKSGDRLPNFVLETGRTMACEATELRRTLEQFSNDPRPGSPQEADWAAWPATTDPQAAARRELRSMMHRQAQLVMVNAFDHISSLGRLLGGDGAMPVFSHLTESRVAGEAAVRFAWIIDPAISSEERIMRGAVCLLVSAEEQLKGFKRAEAGSIPPQFLQWMERNCTQEIERVEKLITSAGIRLARSRDQKAVARLELDSPAVSVPVKFDATEKAAELLPGVPSFYNVGSGVVHSYYWVLRDCVAGQVGSGLAIAPDLMLLGASAEVAIRASMLIIDRCAKYYGHDPSLPLRRSAQRLEPIDQQMRIMGMIKAAGY